MMKISRLHRRQTALLIGGLAALTAGIWGHRALAGAEEGGGPQVQVPTTLDDFIQPGTQPINSGHGSAITMRPIQSAVTCNFCHGEYLEDPADYDEPWDAWVTSTMAQAARDPVWLAAMTIANQDAQGAGEYCIRCHSPGAWLAGRSITADTSGFVDLGTIDDYDGVTCHFCHRAVDPVFTPGVSPPEDESILDELTLPPGGQRGNGRYVVDHEDVRRGPFDDVPENMHGVPIISSPFHRSSEMCATCHDLGNPVFFRQENGSYVISDEESGHGIGNPHPTQNPHQMFPEQRTYSEWLNSQFAKGGVYFGDSRFGGNHATGVMESCQDCHMPDQFTGGCFAWEYEPFFPRPDMPQHSFAGANTWVLRAVRALYPDSETNLSADSVDAATARTADMLRAASDLEASVDAAVLRVRVTNWSGHKLPSGYPEGRRMWLNVQYFDDQDHVVGELGAYDYATGALEEEDTKVYGMEVGIGEDVADAVNLPAGRSLRLVLVNEILKDNRIPPVGFTNAAYDTFGRAPVGVDYADGQHWDDTEYVIPDGEVTAVITLYYQSMTKEYIEFLRDENQTNHQGQIAYDLWADPEIGNKAPPIDMDTIVLDLSGVAPVPGDADGSGFVDFLDLALVLSAWGPCPVPAPCSGDLNGDGIVDFLDLLLVLMNWG